MANNFNQQASGNFLDNDLINYLMDADAPEMPIDPALAQLQGSPSQYLPTENSQDASVSKATQPQGSTAFNVPPLVQPLTLPGPAHPVAPTTQSSCFDPSNQVRSQTELIGPQHHVAGIPGRIGCLSCQVLGDWCSFLTEDDLNNLGHKCADCHLNNRECRTMPNQLPLPPRPLPASTGFPTFAGYGSLASGALTGYQGAAYSTDDSVCPDPPTANSYLSQRPGSFFPPAPLFALAPMVDPAVPAAAPDQQEAPQPGTRRRRETQQVGDDEDQPGPKRPRVIRCHLCRENDFNCVRVVEDDENSGCLKCQTFGLVCWDGQKQQVRPTRPEWAGFNPSISSLYYKFCKRCQDEGFCCDRSRPCHSCRQAGVECREQVDNPKMRFTRNTFQHGTTVGEDGALYRMSLGYGPWGVGTSRLANRRDLPRPMEIFRATRRESGRAEDLSQPRPEIINHLNVTGGVFNFPPYPLDPNDPGLQQLRGRGWTNRQHTEFAYSWNRTGHGRASPESVPIQHWQQHQQQQPAPAQANQFGLVAPGLVPAQRPLQQAGLVNAQQAPQGQGPAPATGGDELDEQELELFEQLRELQANNWQFDQ